jgi:hypothetical protein
MQGGGIRQPATIFSSKKVTLPPIWEPAPLFELRLRPDRLRGRDALGVHRHRPALLPLDDAELGPDPAAVLLVLDPAIGYGNQSVTSNWNANDLFAGKW